VRLIKYTHACVRLEDNDRVLLIDPGTWAEPEAFTGVDDVLVTHEHADHVDVDALKRARQANPALKVYTHAALAAELEELDAQTVSAGDTFTAAGFSVKVVGGQHAEIYDGLPGCPNIGFIVEGNVYHPGDSYFVPDEAVETLLLPISGPWMSVRGSLDFARAIKPARAVGIHEAMLSELGLGNIGRWMEMKGETSYSMLRPGESLTL
jgi:L-ascorbate metabolism protein UlaG (beta-lactamase superfamily)